MSDFANSRPDRLMPRSYGSGGSNNIVSQTPQRSDLGIVGSFKAGREMRKDDMQAVVAANRIARHYQLDAYGYTLQIANEQLKHRSGEAWADERAKSSQRVGRMTMETLTHLGRIEQDAMDIVSTEATSSARKIADNLASGAISERQSNQQRFLLDRREESFRALATSLFDDMNKDTVLFAKRTLLGPGSVNNDY